MGAPGAVDTGTTGLAASDRSSWSLHPAGSPSSATAAILTAPRLYDRIVPAFRRRSERLVLDTARIVAMPSSASGALHGFG
jgi:hypothetical protein